MITIKEALLRNGVFLYGSSTIEDGAGNYMVIRNSSGIVTHRIEGSTFGGSAVVRNVSTGLVESRIELPTL